MSAVSLQVHSENGHPAQPSFHLACEKKNHNNIVVLSNLQKDYMRTHLSFFYEVTTIITKRGHNKVIKSELHILSYLSFCTFCFPQQKNYKSSWLEDGCLTLLADSVRQSSPTDLQSQTLHTHVSCSLLLAPGWRPCMAESVALPLCHQLYPHLKRSKHTTT